MVYDRDRPIAGGRLAKGMCDVMCGVILEREASHAIPSVLETGTLVETEVFAGVMYGMAWKEHAIT